MYKVFIDRLAEFAFSRDQKKSDFLEDQRWVSFDRIVILIRKRENVYLEKNPNYNDQYMFIIRIDRYFWRVPCKFNWKKCRL